MTLVMRSAQRYPPLLRLCARWWERVVAVAREDAESALVDADFDGAIVAGDRGLGLVSERVLIARGLSDAGVGVFNGLAGELGVDLSAGRGRIFRQHVLVAGAGNAGARERVIRRDGGIADGDGVDGNVVREQDLHYVGIAGAAAIFTSVADDEDDLATRAVALGEVLRGEQDGVVEHARFGARIRHVRSAGIDGVTVDRRAGVHWSAAHGDAAAGAAGTPATLDGGRQLVVDGGEIEDLRDGVSEGVER